jgi:hypothetical protein
MITGFDMLYKSQNHKWGVLTMRTNKKMGLLVGCVFLSLSVQGRAEESSCVLLQRLAQNLGCVGAQAPFVVQETTKPFSDEVMSNTFGDGQCATAKTLNEAKSSQKKECQDWLAEQKKELQGRYITGVCKPNCSPCGEGMQKCSVSGEVRYRLDNRAMKP